MWAALKRRIWQWRGVLITAPSVAGVLVALRLAGSLQILELVALDQLFRLRPVEPADPRIVIVTIDESDINKLGQWPMSDAVLARLLLLLKQQHPRVIGLDIYRNLPVEPGHQELVKVFASTPNLIGIKKVVSNAESDAVEASPILSDLGQVSASDLVLDADGRLRRSVLYLKTHDNKIILSLGAKLAFTYLAAQGVTPQNVDPNKHQFRLGQAVFTPLQKNDGGYIRQDAGGYQILSNFRRVRHGFRTISLADVLQGQMSAELVRDRIVLIGIRAESLKDNFYTSITSPDTALAGVEVHAQLTSQLLSAVLEGRPLLRVLPEPFEWLWIVGWSGIGAILGWTSRSPKRTATGVLLFGIALSGGAYLLFLAGWWLIVIPPLFALVGSALISSGYLLVENLKLSHKQLEDYARTLEQKVKERTLELEQEKEALHQQKELLQRIVDHIPVMIMLYDANGQIEFVNQELERVLGWSTAELKGIDLVAESFGDSTDREKLLEHMLAVTGKWLDFKIKTKDNCYVNTSWATIRLSNGIHIGIGQDISERLHAALRERKRVLEASILFERNRMAREIHDTLAQTFVGILLHVEAARQIIAADPNTALADIETVDELARTGLAEARRSVAALRPQLLEEGDLCSAFNRLMSQMSSSTNTRFVCEAIGIPYPLPPEVENNLLRIGQEALTNAIKYACAGEIRIELVYEQSQFTLRIKDDGQGFDVNRVSLSNGFGLVGMTERAEHIGGQLTIQSQLGQGTEVVVILNREWEL